MSAAYVWPAMTGKVLLVVHGAGSDPGRVGRQLKAMGYALDIRRPSRGDVLPASMDEHAAAIIFGGPMSANDDATLEFIRTELEWIPTALESGKPFLGICLGGQLLARALGARVASHPEGLHEIGYYAVRPTPAGRCLFDRETHFYQWHGEGFEVPRAATLLAEGDTFVNQAFACDNAYAIQFHPEVTASITNRWMTKAAHKLCFPGAQSRDEQIRRRDRHERAVPVWLRKFLGRWLES